MIKEPTNYYKPDLILSANLNFFTLNTFFMNPRCSAEFLVWQLNEIILTLMLIL